MKLVLDFDGTLHASDLLWEQFVRIAKRNPLLLFPCIAAGISGGRPALKKALHRYAPLDIQLPWNAQVLNFAKTTSHGYEEVAVVTASDESAARHSIKTLGVDWQVRGSREGCNAKGTQKVALIREVFKSDSFCYIGNSSSADLPVWKASKKTGFVGHPGSKIQIEKKLGRPFEHFFETGSGIPAALLKACRPHQWLKNLLVFVPVFAAHEITNIPILLAALIAFLSLSLIASGVYILNDLCDLDSDRAHPEKNQRPLASGRLPIPIALLAFPAMIAAGLSVSLFAPTMLPIVLGYLALTTLYSFYLKNLMAIDIVILAILYTLRVLAGATACQITPSLWLLAFSFFTFLALAAGKRFSEIVLLGDSIKSHRVYAPIHANPLLALGAAASMIATFLPALYAKDPQVDFYSKPEIFLILMPVLGVWFARFWLLATEGKIKSDPVLFAVKDKFSWSIACLLIVIGLFAINL
jgi:4-hydroxybenzoate polyprenyltransferase